jgi:DNA-binding transcriptional MocR family regulator
MIMPVEQTDVPSGNIDLGSGNPSLELLPIEILERASANYFSAGDRRTLQYGAERGNGYFLAALAEFLSTNLHFDVPMSTLLATNGASAALDLLCTLYTKPGDLIFVEEPTYFLARRIFADHHLQVEPISMDKDGLYVNQLEEKLSQALAKFIYTIPTFHNPANVTLAQDRRERLVNLAHQNNFLIIADEVYQFLAYDMSPPKPLASFANQVEQVISINSFSKILAPGLRLGWIQAHPKVIEQLAECGLLDSGGGLNPFTSGIAYYLIQAGDLAENITKLKGVYQKRLATMNEALAQNLPEADYLIPQGGYYFWVRLPGLDTSQLRVTAQKSGIDFRPGTLFSSQIGLKDYLRLSFSYYNAPQIEMGVKKLAKCVHEDI